MNFSIKTSEAQPVTSAQWQIHTIFIGAATLGRIAETGEANPLILSFSNELKTIFRTIPYHLLLKIQATVTHLAGKSQMNQRISGSVRQFFLSLLILAAFPFTQPLTIPLFCPWFLPALYHHDSIHCQLSSGSWVTCSFSVMTFWTGCYRLPVLGFGPGHCCLSVCLVVGLTVHQAASQTV